MNYECELMDGVKILPLLPNKWLMKRLFVCQQNCHQKVYGGLYICAVGLDIMKFEQTSLFYSASYFNWGGLELCFG